MQRFIEALESMTPFVWQASWQAACLTVLVWAVVMLFGDRIAARWRFVLWSLVFIRLALPVVPTSPTSVFRLSHATVAHTAELDVIETSTDSSLVDDLAIDVAQPVQPFVDLQTVSQADVIELAAQPHDEFASEASVPAQEQSSLKAIWTWGEAAALIWFVVLFMFLARRGAQQCFLARRATCWRPCNDPKTAALVAGCCQRLGIRPHVAVFVSDDQSGPAITGALRPRIVLPEVLLRECSREQLEMILLHELAHVRRRDLLLHEVFLFLRAVHWFNPAAWWAFHRLQTEREMACDDMVLDIAGVDRRHSYGMTLLQVVQNQTRPVLHPGLLGTADRSARLQRRLVMIRDYQARSRRSAWLAIAAVVLLALLGLTKPPAAHTQEPLAEPNAIANGTRQVSENGGQDADNRLKAESFEVKGRCLDDDGKPLADAEVCLFYFDRYGALPKQKVQQKTDATGEFRFERLKPLADAEQQDHYVVAARKPKRSTTARLVFVGDAPGNLDLTLSTDVGTLSGRVTDEKGAPLAGVEVYLPLGPTPVPGFFHDVTNEDGRYSIPNLKCWNADDTATFDPKTGVGSRVAHCSFRLRHPDYPVTIGLYTAIPQVVNVQLKPGITIEGRVVDVVTDKPALGAVVAAQGIKESGSETAVTNNKGVYRLSLTPDRYNIWAQAKDRTCVALDSFEAPVGKVTKAPDLKLVKGGFIVGKVVEKATGKPVTKLPNGRALYVAHHGPARPESGGAVGIAAVQDDGTYRLRVAPGPNYPYLMHDVEAERTPYNATSVDPIMVREGETVTLDFHVSPRGSDQSPEEETKATLQQEPRVRGEKPTTGQEAAKPAGQRRSRDRDDTEVGRLLNQLDELRPKMGQDKWATVLRDLIQLGPAAVPDLIAEMDATDDEYMLRCLGFIMRGIGDKRAIPALIRALPKTCVRGGGDYGFTASDKALLAFLQKHDSDDRERARDWTYSFGSPITEFRVALQKLTGVTHGEDELCFVSLYGTPRQQYLQRSLFQRCAERWAAWWQQNWKLHVDDPRYAAVNLPPLGEESHSTRADEFHPTNGFRHGPKAKIDRRVSGATLESVHNPTARMAFYDLDTGRIGGLPKHLRSANGEPERLDDIHAWAANEGFDLMGAEYTPIAGDKPHYVVRGLGLSAWQIETHRWKTLGAELRNQKPFKTGTRTNGLLANFDVEKGRYIPEDTATFLFHTREGSYGVIFVGVEVHDDKVSPFSVAGPDEELRPNGLFKGRRFGYSLIAIDEAQSD